MTCLGQCSDTWMKIRRLFQSLSCLIGFARIALSCIRYLHRQDPDNPQMQDNLFAA